MSCRQGTGDCGNKLHNSLMRESNRILRNTATENFSSDALPCGEPGVEPIDENMVSTSAATSVQLFALPSTISRLLVLDPRGLATSLAPGGLIKQH